MFTGIIEETGKIQTITSNKITVECKTVLDDIKLGDSIAVNGICLTVTDFTTKTFSADVSCETMNVTSFRNLKANHIVNLERAMKADGRFGGHIVQGHVDGLGNIVSIKDLNNFYELRVKLNPSQAKYTVKKGSIAIDGISLTIADINDNEIVLAIIPHTFENTNLKTLNSNNIVNIEVDITAKYIEKFLLSSNNESRINLEFLQEHGF